MNNFFARWRLSRLHDDGREPPPALRAKLDRSESLARHARTLDTIDRELSDHAPLASPSPELRHRTLTIIAETAARSAAPARAPLWPLLTSLTVAATSLMLFIARPWQAPHTTGPGTGPIAADVGAGHVMLVDDRIRRETDALVDDTRRLANSLFRDALPFAPGR
ncbi:MAG: hypothetical protein IT436_09410 [Phycisphaerales bacterium]|nr:hypothetical protein [Phycisphaerales bacterium]